MKYKSSIITFLQLSSFPSLITCQNLRKTTTTTTTTTTISFDNNNTPPQRQQQKNHRQLWTHLVHFADPKTLTSKSEGYDRAHDESYGFFYDVSLSDWDRMRTISHHRQSDNHVERDWKISAQRYYQENWEPDFSCPHERRIGKMGDGGKWVCDPHRIAVMSSVRKTPDGKPDPCLVYSIGSAGRHDFEQGIMDIIGEDVCEIHTFEIRSFDEMDIQDITAEDKRKTKMINFHYEWGIRGTNDPPRENYHTLSETIRSLGHEGRTIDIFKIDCEGCEWNTYLDWIRAPAHLQQILVEVHSYNDKSNDFFQSLQDAGYVTFHKEPNFISKGNCLEYAFLKLKPAAKPASTAIVPQPKKGDYDVASRESFGFFYDVPAAEWETAKDIMKERRRHNHVEREWRVSVQRYYQENWEPDFSCPFEMRIGKMGDGGKWVCDPHRINVMSTIRKTADGKPDPCLVYSVGSAGRHDFEHAVMDVIGEDVCEIHTFEARSYEEMDIQDKTDEEKQKTKKINFHYNWGILGSNDKPRPNFYTLADTIRELGHEGRTIDIFKIDCEGCEWRTYRDWINAPAYLMQMLVEVHGNPTNVDDFFQSIQDAGYVTYHKELNYLSKGSALEYAFLKLNIEDKVGMTQKEVDKRKGAGAGANKRVKKPEGGAGAGAAGNAAINNRQGV